MVNTKSVGNKAESVILSCFVKHNIPVLLPFGDNEKYDLVIDINGRFQSVQVKNRLLKEGKIMVDLRHRIGVKRIKYETYFNKVDFIAVWCEKINRCFLMPLERIGKKTSITLDKPKNNSSITKVIWSDEFDFEKVILRVGEVVSHAPHKPKISGANPLPATKEN